MGIHRIRFRDPAGTIRDGTRTDGKIHCATGNYVLEAVDVLPPVEPSKIVCVGLNYERHAKESGLEVPNRPLLFLKGPNALAGHGATVSLLPGKKRVDSEAELGVVIAEQCRHVSEDEAMNVVTGFTCANDISNHDDQEVEQNWIRGKAFDNSAPLGPVLATPDEVPEDARIQLRINGETKQDSSREDMIFTVPELVSEIATYLTLEPGDVILTGTPEGIGPLTDGDHVEIEIEGIGILEHNIVGG